MDSAVRAATAEVTNAEAAPLEEAALASNLPKAISSDDDFEPSQVFGVPIRNLPVIPPNPPSGKPRSGILELLDEAEEPGVFFQERDSDGNRADEGEDPELDEAVEEAIRLLFGIRGIHHVGPGFNAAGDKVVLISANTGFSESALGRVPKMVRGFPTLLALPYELLPLRRDRS